MELLYTDQDLVVCIKPPRVLSTDEPGGLPELVRQALGDPHADVRTVHRLDRVVSGVMVLARNAAAAGELSRQIREDRFFKEYLAVVHGCPPEEQGTFTDLLYRDKARRMTMVATEPGKGVQEAVLDYRLLSRAGELSKVEIHLRTGRTHQIRVQFASRGMPLVGERKYSEEGEETPLALFSAELSFLHPKTGAALRFEALPPPAEPWGQFADVLNEKS